MVSVEVSVPTVVVKVAVTVTSSVAPTFPTVTVKLTRVVPAGTVTLEGTGKLTWSEEERETVVKPVGTATVRSTVHVVVSPPVTVLGSQVIEDSTGVAKTGTVTTLLRKSFCAIYNSAN